MLAPAAAEILRGDRGPCELRSRSAAAGSRSRKSASAPPREALDPAARSLWAALRAWRLDEARRAGIPPYVIFHDATLIEVARRRPGSR